MRRYKNLGGRTGLLLATVGLGFSVIQGCADGDSSDESTGGTSGVGGATNGEVGGEASSGGSENTDASTTTHATGGKSNATGGASAAGGTTAKTSSVGGASSVGGSTSESTAPAGGSSGVGGQSGVGGIMTDGGASAAGGAATGGAPGITCKTSLDCISAPDSQTVCSVAGQCVQCVQAADCGEDGGYGFECLSNRCVAYDPCSSDDECASGGCDTARGRCVECVTDGNCSDGKRCVEQKCRVNCDSDNDCTPQHMLCNTSIGVCIQCTAELACGNGLLCSPTGLCVPPVCTAGQRTCVAGGIGTCAPNGSGYGIPAACPVGSTCEEVAGKPSCYSADGGLACFVPGDPCQHVEPYADTQKLDGVGDDFCGVPTYTLNAQTAARVISWHSAPKEVAKIQVAWADDGLHIFVDVEDSSVQTVQMKDPTAALTRAYMGDSIEILFSSSDAVTGLTATDANTLHVQIPASGPAVSIKTSNTSGTSEGVATALTAPYAQKITATGYAIEAKLPWPGNVKPARGSQIRFDLTLNGADTDCTSVDDMRDGGLVMHLGQVPNSTCQSNDGSVPYCDDRLWCATSLL